MNPYNFSVLCFGFCSLLVGLFVWLKRQDRLGRTYFVFTIFCAAFALPFANNFNPNASYKTALLTSRLANGLAIMIPVTWYHFVLIFLGEENKRKQIIKILYLISAFLLCFIFTRWFVPDIIWIAGFYSAVAGPLHIIFALLFFSVVPLSFFDLMRGWKTLSAPERANRRSFAAVVGVAYLGGSMTFLPAYGVAFPQYGLFLMPLYPFAMAYFLTRQKLFDIEELAQAAHRDKLMAIGVLAASINHEVRSPLYVIHGMAEGYLEKQKEGLFAGDRAIIERSNEIMKKTMEQSERAMDIIKRLSMFAKSGIEQEIKMVPVRIQEVIEELLPLIRHELILNNIRLDLGLPADLPAVRADKGCLEEIIFNLLVNASQAIKAAGQPGVIRFEAAAHGDKLILTISDSGPGIPQDKLNRVFRPFYTTKDEGTGLGLYITQQLADKIGIRIKVESEEGKGACFALECKTCALKTLLL